MRRALCHYQRPVGQLLVGDDGLCRFGQRVEREFQRPRPSKRCSSNPRLQQKRSWVMRA